MLVPLMMKILKDFSPSISLPCLVIGPASIFPSILCIKLSVIIIFSFLFLGYRRMKV